MMTDRSVESWWAAVRFPKKGHLPGVNKGHLFLSILRPILGRITRQGIAGKKLKS